MTEPKTLKDALAELWLDVDSGVYTTDAIIAKVKALLDRAQPEQAPADVKELIRKYQHEVDYLEQIERTEFGDDSLSTYSIFLKELKGLSSQPPAVAGDDLIVSSIEFIKGQIKEGKHLHADGAFFATDDGFVIRVSSVKADINARIRGEAPPAGEVPGLRENIETVRSNYDWQSDDVDEEYKKSMKSVLEAARQVAAGQPNGTDWESDYHALCERCWKALGITEYTGKDIAEHIAELIAAGQGVRGDLPYSTELSDKRVEKFMEDYGAPNSTSLFCMLKQYENQIRHEITEALKGVSCSLIG